VGQDIRLMRSRKVTGAGSGLVSHAGMVWLAGVADHLGLTEGSQALFGTVPSYPTTWRTFARLGPVELRGIDSAMAGARSRAWPAGGGPADDDVFIVDVDATIVTTKADKQTRYRPTNGPSDTTPCSP
jgi:hypothetical protein